ncbi:MAG: LapA family protein [Porticoccaceae bacterium]|nr:LapA family protein [Porticoccaceae bacterium]
MKKLIAGLVLVLFVFVGLWTAQDNTQPVAVTLLGFEAGHFALGLWLVLAFLAGVVVALVATLPIAWRLAAARRKLQLHSKAP